MAEFKKWLYRDCCKKVVDVSKKFGEIEQYMCACGKTTQGKYLKYFDTQAEAEKVRAQKTGDMPPDLEGMM